MIKKTTVEKTREAWGPSLPDWVQLMAENCDQTSQASFATRIGYSPAVVNTVLGCKYKGDIGAVKQAVEGALMHATVQCPVYGDLEGHHCLEYQRRKFAATNPTRVRLFRACRDCTNNRTGRNV
ncbi:MAG: transcriptional regulator [Gammaproteobacteria bacterium]|nr:transcriptional regulator [Gammaproteobacteria bacterium]